MTEQLSPREDFAREDTATAPPPRLPAPRAPGGAAERQRTCAACGARFEPGQRTGLEVLVDGEVRYVAVHRGHSTHAAARERQATSRLRAIRPQEHDAAA
ncbi:hypothetical protein VA596_45980 [Amycolatopsis sp., V23-08]|uniref:Uncharacterized protein n=1 Tax=Amycolatopsis heterodermiae TaxID=3110235 RepID=A0ABU5RMY5_9PSEU|nr:hypothetical protein [Amycolatopsis sp., V23-08]MEA5366949.1 hypothetical protein [Amycolatopsis sp., V23-08]